MQAPKIATSYSTILGQMIRKLREDQGSDQADLAKHLGVSVMTVSRIESGDTVLDVPQMEKTAEFFGIAPIDFFKMSLDAKQEIESKNYTVVQNKKQLNKNPSLALLSIGALGLLIGILLSRK